MGNKRKTLKQKIAEFIEGQQDPNRILRGGWTPLQKAIRNDDFHVVLNLLDNKADPNNSGIKGADMKPLAMAIAIQSPNIAYALLHAGANPNEHIGKLSYLSAATHKRNRRLIQRLFENDVNPNVRDQWTNETPLFHLDESIADFADLLVKNGVPIDARDNKGCTALYNMILNRKYRCAKRLLDLKADASIDPFCENSYSKLMEIAMMRTRGKGMSEDLWYLIPSLTAKRANTEIKDPQTNETLYMRAIEWEDGIMLGLYSAICRNRFDRDFEGNTPLHKALIKGNHKITLNVLGMYRSYPKEKNLNNKTVMDILNSSDYIHDRDWENVVKILNRILEIGGDVNHLDNKGDALLHKAIEYRRNAFIPVILKHNPDLELENKAGYTPLGLAVERKDLDLVDELLDKGANPSHKDGKGWTILDRLSREGDRTSPIVQRLIAAGGVYAKQLPANDHAHQFSQNAKRQNDEDRKNDPDGQGFKISFPKKPL